MERLTWRVNGEARIMLNGVEICGTIADRLAAYEDTGLEPEEIISAVDMGKVACALHELNAYKELGPIDRLRELAEADREGRCMVVPSDYDGEMFKIWKGQILSSRRFVNNIKELGKTVFLTRADAEAALRREQE